MRAARENPRLRLESSILKPLSEFQEKRPKLRGGVHGSAHVHESKYFFAFARYEPSLFNLIRCLWTIRKGIGNSGGNFLIWLRNSHANNCKHINHGINPTYGSTLNSISTIWVQSTSIFCEFWSSVILLRRIIECDYWSTREWDF